MNILELRVLDTTEAEIASIKNIRGLEKAKNLEVLVLDYNIKIEDLEPIKDIKTLRVISANNTNIKELPNMTQLKNLETLHIDNNKIKDLSVLNNLDELKSFSALNQNIEIDVCSVNNKYTVNLNDIIKDRDKNNSVIAENISGSYEYDKATNSIIWGSENEVLKFNFKNKEDEADFTGTVNVKRSAIDNNLDIAIEYALKNQ